MDGQIPIQDGMYRTELTLSRQMQLSGEIAISMVMGTTYSVTNPTIVLIIEDIPHPTDMDA